LRCAAGDFGVDRITVSHLGSHQLTGQLGRIGIARFLGQVAFQNGVGRSLPEIRLEDRRQSEPPAGPAAADAVSPRRHRPGS
jgi:hypothetical protein